MNSKQRRKHFRKNRSELFRKLRIRYGKSEYIKMQWEKYRNLLETVNKHHILILDEENVYES